MSAAFEAILDRCIDDVGAGRRSIEACLDAHPQHREALEPVLRAAFALQDLPSAPERPVNLDRRAELMAALARTPQQSPRRALPRMPVPALPALPSLPTLGLGSLGQALVRTSMVAAPAAVLVLLAVVLTLGRGAEPATASTLTLFAGAVERHSSGGWQPLEDGALVHEGDRLRTAQGGRALLTFPDGSTVTLEPGTDVAIDRLRMEPGRQVVLEQFAGRLWNDVAHGAGEGRRYDVRTPDALITVHGTKFETSVAGDETSVVTAEGLVAVEAGSERRELAPGRTVAARAQQFIEEQDELPPGLARLVVDGPFTAALFAEDGSATGARPDGVIYHQIAGVVTSNPGEGAQQIALSRVNPGVYTLVLRRIGDGTGDLLVATEDGEWRLPVQAAQQARVQLRAEVGADGAMHLVLLDDEPAEVAEGTLVERVVLPSVAQQRAVPLAQQRAQRRGPPITPPGLQGRQQPPTATSTPTATATAEPQTATASPTPEGPPAAVVDLRERLLAAVVPGDPEDTAARIREVLQEAGIFDDRVEAARGDDEDEQLRTLTDLLDEIIREGRPGNVEPLDERLRALLGLDDERGPGPPGRGRGQGPPNRGGEQDVEAPGRSGEAPGRSRWLPPQASGGEDDDDEVGGPRLPWGPPWLR